VDNATKEPSADILRKVQGMLNIAAKAGTPEEAANATAMAQRFMEQHNIDSAMLERAAGTDAKRAKDAVQGGQYQWQRDLWSSIASLNFCLYWTQEYYAVRERTERSTVNPNRVYYKGQQVVRKRHVIVGRTVNVLTVKAMGGYIQDTITRVAKDTFTDSTGKLSADYNGRSGLSFREGMADDIMERLNKRRMEMLGKERRKKQAAEANASSGTALTLSTYIDEETDANNDFLHGKGWSAQQAADRAEAAAERKAQREAYTIWAAANPEEAAKQAEENRKRDRRRGGYGNGPREREKDWSMYRRGEAAGKSVGLDPQMSESKGPTKAITGGKVVYG
jgi:hypothetical protein